MRKVEPRNTPTNINAVFNFRNFWDGRANNSFNGVDPFGLRNGMARVFKKNGSAVMVDLRNSSVASQAMGPPENDFEMICSGRKFAELGFKLIPRRALAFQKIHKDDSVLGGTKRSKNGMGLKDTYGKLIQKAFKKEWWGSKGDFDGYTQMEANFSLFWGVAIQLYQATLISDQSPYDKFAEGHGEDFDPETGNKEHLTKSEFRGLKIFLDKGKCINCHKGPEFSGAASILQAENEEGGLVERMLMSDGGVALYDNGFYNIGVTPTKEDVGVGGMDPYGNPLAWTEQFINDDYVDSFEVDPCKFEVPFNEDEIAIASTFDVDKDGFMYLDDPFRGTHRPYYSSGKRVDIGGEHGGVLQVKLGGINNHNIHGISGGWKKKFELSEAAEVSFSFQFNLTQNSDYESDEYSQVLASIDGKLVGTSPHDYVAQITGNGNGGPDQSTGWQLFEIELGELAAGSHTLIIGGFNNKKTWYNEVTTIQVDAISVIGKRCHEVPDNLQKERTAVRGAFKVPILRNVELTGPFMHNGGMSTLEQVVEFYNRGGNFSNEELDPDITPLDLSDGEKADLVAFLKSLTDPNVTNKCAPFDHPQLFVPNGHPGDEKMIEEFDEDSLALDSVIEVPAVGKYGLGQLGLPQLEPFHKGLKDPSIISQNSFDRDAEGYRYKDDVFLGTNQGYYASGDYTPNGGFQYSGGLRVVLGGINNADINGMSGGWSTSFSVDHPKEGYLAFRYNLTQANNFESDEYSKALVSLNGEIIDAELATLVGNGNGGSPHTTGWKLAKIDLGLLNPGVIYTLTIGAFANKKTYYDETVELLIDDVFVSSKRMLVDELGVVRD